MGKDYGRRIRLTPEEESVIYDFRNGHIHEYEQKFIDHETGKENWEGTGFYIRRRVPKDKRILVVGDIHAPFVRKGYLEHCCQIRDKYRANYTVFIGDIIDNHYSSFHSTDPDGYGAGEELERAIDIIAKWFKEFPNEDVILGNHDNIILRQIFAAGISKQWIRRFSDVLKTPTWNFTPNVYHDGVKYTHGVRGGSVNGAMTKARNRGVSLVQGHWHAKSYIRWHVTDNTRIFAMQVGCGVDENAYAMAYNEDPMERWIMSCGVVLENGQLPILEPMRL